MSYCKYDYERWVASSELPPVKLTASEVRKIVPHLFLARIKIIKSE